MYKVLLKPWARPRKIDVEGVRVNVVHSAAGAINESDITLGVEA